jgi:hypothetical protein
MNCIFLLFLTWSRTMWKAIFFFFVHAWNTGLEDKQVSHHSSGECPINHQVEALFFSLSLDRDEFIENPMCNSFWWDGFRVIGKVGKKSLSLLLRIRFWSSKLNLNKVSIKLDWFTKINEVPWGWPWLKSKIKL